MISRVFRKPSLQQEDRLPIASYDEALNRLVQYRCDETLPDEAYDVAVSIVADIFWLNDTRVRRDVAVRARQIGA